MASWKHFEKHVLLYKWKKMWRQNWIKVFLFTFFTFTLLFLFDLVHYKDLALVHFFTWFSYRCPCDLQCFHYASSAVPPIGQTLLGFKALYCSTPNCCALPQISLDSLPHVVQCSINITAQRNHPGHNPLH